MVGDILLILLFALLGQGEHRTFSGVAGVFITAWPFLAGWLAVGVAAGLYQAKHYRSYSAMLKRTLIVWVLGIPFGMLLRILFQHTEFKPPFLVVAMIVNFIFLFGWRFLFVSINKRRNV